MHPTIPCPISVQYRSASRGRVSLVQPMEHSVAMPSDGGDGGSVDPSPVGAGGGQQHDHHRAVCCFLHLHPSCPGRLTMPMVPCFNAPRLVLAAACSSTS